MSSTAATRPKTSAKRGTIYWGGTGMLTWLLHRISGIAVVYFLPLHIYEALQLFGGPAAYNEATAAYKQPWFRPFEVALILAVTYHALNGLRVSMFDLFPKTTKHHRTVFKVGAAIFVLIALAISFVMLRPLFGMPLGDIFKVESTSTLIYALVIVLPVGLPVLYLAWRGSGLATGPMIVSQSSSRPAPTTNQFERAMWSFMRLSGFIMIILVFAHITLMHFINPIENITGQFVFDRFAALPAWAWIDLTILFFAWLHGLNGLRVVLTDYIRRGMGRKVVLGIIGLFGVVWFALGAWVLFYVQQQAALLK
ncbi:MAG: succinate dehydrogenase, cytochrome b556 subunit [Chloroflexi bacterium]|nr:succinate dehydrogenase, cytochrome b556 subunit [Chloroflexota bacterium]